MGKPPSLPGTGKRLLFISHSRRLYGANRSLLELLWGLRAAGFDCAVVIPGEGPMAVALDQAGILNWYCDVPCWSYAAGAAPAQRPSWSEFERATAHVSEQVQAWQAHAVWSNSSVTPIGALLARLHGLPHIWHLREENGGSHEFQFLVDDAHAISLLNAATVRIAVSEFTRSHYSRIGCTSSQRAYSPIGSADTLRARTVPSVRAGGMNLLLAGRIRESKGQMQAVRALAVLHQRGYRARLRIVGDGDQRRCQQLAEQLGVSAWLELVGFHHDLQADYAWADIAMCCSREESMGRVTVEAMSYGVPIVGHATGGTLELIEDKVTGLLYGAGKGSLVDNLQILVEQPQLAQRLVQQAHAWVQEHFTREAHIAVVLPLVSEVLLEAQSDVDNQSVDLSQAEPVWV